MVASASFSEMTPFGAEDVQQGVPPPEGAVAEKGGHAKVLPVRYSSSPAMIWIVPP